MKSLNQHRGYFLIAVIIMLIIAFAVYPPFRSQAQRKDIPKAGKQMQEDTTRRKSVVPGNTHKTYAELQVELDKAMKDLDHEMERLQTEEWPKVQEEMARSLRELDAAKIKQQMDLAMKDIDMKKIKADVEKAMQEAQLQNIDAKMKEQLSKMDMQKMELEMAKAKMLSEEQLDKQMEQLKEQMSRMKIDMKQTMEQATQQMQKAKAHLNLLQEGLNELEKEGLVKKGDKVSIEWKDDILILNDKPQSKEVSARYKKYFGEGSFQMNNHERKLVL
jgi:hypothetical protein